MTHAHHPHRARARVDPCLAPKYALALAFVTANHAVADQLASQLQTKAANLLGLSGVESGWGSGPLIAGKTNNYFSLAAGPAFSGTTGTFKRGKYVFGVYPDPGYLNSGQSFASSYFGARVCGVMDADAFAKAVNSSGSFNSEKLATP